MALSIAERKHRMPFGAYREIASEIGVHPAYVTRTVNGEVIAKTEPARKKLRRVQVAVARRLHLRVDEVFPPTQAPEPEPNEAQVA